MRSGNWELKSLLRWWVCETHFSVTAAFEEILKYSPVFLVFSVIQLKWIHLSDHKTADIEFYNSDISPDTQRSTAESMSKAIFCSLFLPDCETSSWHVFWLLSKWHVWFPFLETDIHSFDHSSVLHGYLCDFCLLLCLMSASRPSSSTLTISLRDTSTMRVGSTEDT